VEQRCRFDRLDRVIVLDAKLFCQGDRRQLHATDVSVRHFVLRIDGGRERLDRRQVERVQFFEMTFRVLQPSE
jgi:hypothetical protein